VGLAFSLIRLYLRSHSLHRAARAIVPQSLHGLGNAIVIHEVLDCLAKSAGLLLKEAEANVAIVTKDSAHLIRFVIVIHYESCRAVFNVNIADGT
jgi:predicted nucleic acid-binding protein